MRARPATLVTIAAVVLTMAPVGVAIAGADSAGATDGARRTATTTTSSSTTTSSTTTTTAPPVLLPHPAVVPDLYIWPANGPITSPYGRRWGRAHQGVDIDAPTGSAVVATQAGTVVRSGWYYGYGKCILIDHGFGIATMYSHLSGLNVSAGQYVPQGHYLGPVGATGSVTAAHLHYEVHVNGVPVNPMPWL